MTEPVERLERDVGTARKAGDIPALLVTASAAIAELEATAKQASGPESIALLTAAKRIAYNAAADAWPGWEVGGPVRSDEALQAGRLLAVSCKALVARLGLPAGQRANADWLIGAFDLALGRFREAEAQFRGAAADFAAEPEASLMARGYQAIAAQLIEGARQADTTAFDRVIADLTAMGTQDAEFFKQQLMVARELFGADGASPPTADTSKRR